MGQLNRRGGGADNPDALVIGAGPAGLMAAEMLGAAGARVLLAEAKPSLARKFLMAGKSGLNLTKHQDIQSFIGSYPEGQDALRPILEAFGPEDLMDWAKNLGEPLFVGSTGRVFPEAMKASPLLRKWLARLDGYGVVRRMRWRWTGWQEGVAAFETPEGVEFVRPKVTILALGGASWARLGSDGAWAKTLEGDGHKLTPFQPSNVGLRVTWSSHMARHFGAPVKASALRAGTFVSRGEVVISSKGLEGGGLYPLSPALRAGEALWLDLMPGQSQEALTARLANRPRGKASLKDHLRKALRFGPVQIALAQEFGRPLAAEPAVLAAQLKALTVRHDGFRPMDEAISTSGGLSFQSLDEDLMLSNHPGVFCAGEMLDWDAPTGGYLLTACFATGRWAGLAAARHLGL